MDSMNERSAADELAAAEAELKAAQERLDAARLRAASEQPQPYAQPADAPVVSQEPQSQPIAEATAAPQGTRPQTQVAAAWQSDQQPYAQAQQVSYAAQPQQPMQPASYGSQPQPRQPTQPAAAWQPDAQQVQGQPYASQPGAQQPNPPYAAPQQGSPYAQPQPQAQAPQQPYGAQPGYGSVPPQNPYGQQAQYGYQQPYAAPAVGEKDHVAAGLLALFLGWLGVHKFYLGYNTSGFIMLGTSILGGILTLSVASWAIWVIAIVEGIFYLSKSQTEFEQMYVINKREWF